MKIKILVFPVVLALSITIIIAYGWPQYGSLRKAVSELKQSEATLQSVVQKKNNIKNLQEILIDNQDKKDLVLDFLPMSKSEEDIINGLNYIASGSGATLSLLLENARKTGASAAEGSATAVSGSKDVLFAGASAASGTLSAAQPWDAQPRFTEIKATVTGKYENIRTFLEQVYKMEMFNEIASVEIEKQETRNEEGVVVNSELLSAILKINFGYLPEIKIGRDLSAPIFSQSSFNFAPYEKLASVISKNIPVLETGEQGRANPFLP